MGQDLLKYKPNLGNPEEARLSLQELIALNPDVRAWITIDGTHIDYPMTQGKDDMEYVNKDAKGDFALSGAIFLSAQNKPDFSDPYMLTYGLSISSSICPPRRDLLTQKPWIAGLVASGRRSITPASDKHSREGASI